MNPIQSWQLLLGAVAGWTNRAQQDLIAFIQEENRVLKGKRNRFWRQFGVSHYRVATAHSL